jgi:hypothetical protein
MLTEINCITVFSTMTDFFISHPYLFYLIFSESAPHVILHSLVSLLRSNSLTHIALLLACSSPCSSSTTRWRHTAVPLNTLPLHPRPEELARHPRSADLACGQQGLRTAGSPEVGELRRRAEQADLSADWRVDQASGRRVDQASGRRAQ